QFNLIQGVGAKTVQIVRQATTTQDQIKLLQPYHEGEGSQPTTRRLERRRV
ncbi:hypothetical protein Rin_00022230, partial [Candidatus Regiella insecticola 5.15]